jgi:hypothetical protein
MCYKTAPPSSVTRTQRKHLSESERGTCNEFPFTSAALNEICAGTPDPLLVAGRAAHVAHKLQIVFEDADIDAVDVHVDLHNCAAT